MSCDQEWHTSPPGSCILQVTSDLSELYSFWHFFVTFFILGSLITFRRLVTWERNKLLLPLIVRDCLLPQNSLAYCDWLTELCLHPILLYRVVSFFHSLYLSHLYWSVHILCLSCSSLYPQHLEKTLPTKCTLSWFLYFYLCISEVLNFWESSNYILKSINGAVSHIVSDTS